LLDYIKAAAILITSNVSEHITGKKYNYNSSFMREDPLSAYKYSK